MWLNLHPILRGFSRRLAAAHPELLCDLGRSANDTFVLRAYLAVKRSASGEEVAITVDVRSDGQALIVESDACLDNGKVLAAGPSVTISLTDEDLCIESAFSGWLSEFERFLSESEAVVELAIAGLA